MGDRDRKEIRGSKKPDTAAPAATPASGVTAADVGASPDPRLSSLTLSQVWGIGAALLALVGGAFGFGVFVTNAATERLLMEKEKTLLATERELTDAKSQKATCDVDLAKTKVLLENAQGIGAQWQVAVENSKAYLSSLEAHVRFLGQYNSYLRAPADPTAKSLFVDLVCAMWRKDQNDRVRIEERALRLDQVSGAAPPLRELLEKQGITPDLVRMATTPREVFEVKPFGLTTRKVRRVVEPDSTELRRTLSELNVVKVVSFGAQQYRLPDEIAVEVHSRPDCKP